MKKKYRKVYPPANSVEVPPVSSSKSRSSESKPSDAESTKKMKRGWTKKAIILMSICVPAMLLSFLISGISLGLLLRTY